MTKKMFKSERGRMTPFTTSPIPTTPRRKISSSLKPMPRVVGAYEQLASLKFLDEEDNEDRFALMHIQYRKLSETYKIVDKIGMGDFCSVYKVECLRTGSHYACKIVDKKLGPRAQEEARVLARINREN